VVAVSLKETMGMRNNVNFEMGTLAKKPHKKIKKQC